MSFRLLRHALLASVVISPLFQVGLASAQSNADKRTRQAADAKKADAKKADAKKADAKKAAAKRAAAKRAASSRKPVTLEQIQRVDSFVKKNMPELGELLGVLKDAEPTRYQQAIRELSSAAERLGRLESRDPEGYELALESWKLEKKLQLVLARVRMDRSASSTKQLKSLLEERFAVELEILDRNRQRMAARLTKLDEEIARRKKNHRDEIERLVDNWTKTGPAKKGTTPVSERRTRKPGSRTSPKKPDAKKTETNSKAKATR